MARSSYHDIVIVGSDVAGLLAGSLLSRRKYRVLQVIQGHLGVSYQDHGMEMIGAPQLLPPYGHAPVLDNLLKEIGIEDPVHVLGAKDRTALQVITPEQRIDLFSDDSLLKSELARAFPEQKDATLELINRLRMVDEQFKGLLSGFPNLPPDGIREKAKAKRNLATLEQLHLPDPSSWAPLMKIMAAATGFLSNFNLERNPVFVTGHHVLSLLGGLRSVPDFKKLLLKATAKAGSDVEEKIVVEEIIIERKNATGIRTLRSSQTYNCQTVIASLSVNKAVELVPLSQRHKRFLATANSVRPGQSLFVLNLVVPNEILPLGMGNQLLLVRRMNEPLTEDNLIKIQCLGVPDRKGRSLLNLSCLVPYRKRSLGREYLGPLQKRLLEAAGWLIPFLDANLEAQSSPFWEGRSGDEPHPSPWSMHQIFETKQNVGLGCSILHAKTPYKNIFYCGPEAIPGLGIEGAAYAARQTSNLIQEKMKLKKVI